MTTPNDPKRWELRQRLWEETPPDIEHTRAAGWLTLHAEPRDPGDGCRLIHALTTDGGVYVGMVFFGPHPAWAGRLEGAPEVHPDYRRRGICRALYDWAAELGGAPMAPADTHSDDAAAFWARYGRPEAAG
ncbi:GNAT family N-acetyltransferase [Streptomyces violaceusniger]|uniref:N-acetyltransferase domain-containing protein n=1 Tax=Streptomyces violaceusniger (strain Tu 4113) TaxID=653045 RepID=G2PHP9_STRV4|nr:GNAT family N-acetyltransferase [Streptomyces violaceusniger]AEM88850.1 hypothetical protein Strvi_0074 [Streptomyces violaceusniger Tu 4113]